MPSGRGHRCPRPPIFVGTHASNAHARLQRLKRRGDDVSVFVTYSHPRLGRCTGDNLEQARCKLARFGVRLRSLRAQDADRQRRAQHVPAIEQQPQLSDAGQRRRRTERHFVTSVEKIVHVAAPVSYTHLRAHETDSYL
eukprot:4177010-Pleurochrysis_carterae.AAC.1